MEPSFNFNATTLEPNRDVKVLAGNGNIGGSVQVSPETTLGGGLAGHFSKVKVNTPEGVRHFNEQQIDSADVQAINDKWGALSARIGLNKNRGNNSLNYSRPLGNGEISVNYSTKDLQGRNNPNVGVMYQQPIWNR